jgi:hypothetical protein
MVLPSGGVLADCVPWTVERITLATAAWNTASNAALQEDDAE